MHARSRRPGRAWITQTCLIRLRSKPDSRRRSTGTFRGLSPSNCAPAYRAQCVGKGPPLMPTRPCLSKGYFAWRGMPAARAIFADWSSVVGDGTPLSALGLEIADGLYGHLLWTQHPHSLATQRYSEPWRCDAAGTRSPEATVTNSLPPRRLPVRNNRRAGLAPRHHRWTPAHVVVTGIVLRPPPTPPKYAAANAPSLGKQIQHPI